MNLISIDFLLVLLNAIKHIDAPKVQIVYHKVLRPVIKVLNSPVMCPS
jgi:hypothetical protein